MLESRCTPPFAGLLVFRCRKQTGTHRDDHVILVAGFQLCLLPDAHALHSKLGVQKLIGCSSFPVSMNSRILSLPQDNYGPSFAYAKHRRISAGIFHPPVFNDIGGRSKLRPKKCQQNCQQKSSRGVRGEFSTSSPVSLESSPISVPKTRGEGRRFRPSPPALTACAVKD